MLKIKCLQITPLQLRDNIIEYIYKKKLIKNDTNMVKLDDSLKKILNTKISPVTFEEVEELVEKWALQK
jgi:hypothetical protein